MTTEDELFTEEDPTPVDDQNPLEALVGEGKKFKTPADLAKGKLESDRFILQLQGELKTMREDLNGRIKLEEFMDRLGTNQVAKQPVSTSDTSSTENTDPSANSKTQTITKEDVEQLLSARERETLQKANLSRVAEALRQSLGDNFQGVINQRAKDLDLDTAYLTDLAKNRPSAFLKIMVPKEADKAPEAPSKKSLFPTGSVNASAMKTDVGPFKKYSEFSKMRKENPRLYNTPEIQQEMYRLTKEYKDDFLNS